MAKILVADDNSNIQKMVGLALKDQGIDVVAVGNGEAAVRKISDIRPDLVLADVFMPVRNGYEVCRYVKEDTSLAHIPVILLVGAFDPLDEQEAQRVGADGVLKKPFVPPDPLVSMVKSALMRAGIPLGPAGAEKAPEAPKRSAAEIMSRGMEAKPAPMPPVAHERLPEVTPEPLEEFPMPTSPRLKIAAGSEPLAFGSLLETPEADDLAVTAKPMINLAEERKWDEEPDEVQEEEEAEETSNGGWHPAGLGEMAEPAPEATQGVRDWREEAFHGTSPAKSFTTSHWAPSVEEPALVEAAESPAIAVATEFTKPGEVPASITSDAWATAMAAGVEEKLAEMKEAGPVVPEIPAPAVQEIPESTARTEDAVEPPAAVMESTLVEQPAGPENWAAAPETAWEAEAKKASLLASTWDSPATFSSEDTQEVPAYTSETRVEEVEAHTESSAESSVYSAEPMISNEPAEHLETIVSEPAESSLPEVAEPKNWENAWETPAPPTELVTEVAPEKEPQIEEQPSMASAREPAIAEPATVEPTAAVHLSEPDMDELVARVLGKMNPEVLQRVTREILKPVIEAIVRDEISSKKS